MGRWTVGNDVSVTTPVHKARKAHRCEECWQTIQPGEAYLRNSGVFEGEPYSYPLCQKCEALWRLCWEHSDRFHFDHGDPVPVSGLRDHFVDIDVLQRDEVWSICGVTLEFADLLEYAPDRPWLPVQPLPRATQ